MKKSLLSETYKGSIAVPSSKSFMQRAIAIATLAKGTTILSHPAKCNDTDAAMRMGRDLGAIIRENQNNIEITGTRRLKSNILNAGESGLGLRMFTPIAALFNKEIQLKGEGSLTGRPITMLEQPLRQLGCSIRTNNGFVPAYVEGPMIGGKAQVDGSVSSQLLTGLLIALPYAQQDTELLVTNLKSIPYVEMTMQIMKSFGIDIAHEDFKCFKIAGNQEYKACNYEIEGDWSAGAFHLVGAAIAGDVELTHLSVKSSQADRAIIQALEAVGAGIKIKTNSIRVYNKKLMAFEFDATHCPDLFPPLAILAAACNGLSKIKGLSRLKHKESNRAAVLAKELTSIGVDIKLQDDYMLVHGGEIIGGTIHSNNDHRIAMAGAIAGLISQKPVKVLQKDAVSKSYPQFWDDYDSLKKITV
ncbi:MAG: 3-phosphoshikimate 1-carboxyvinyltransferase [Bacteroidales bacterium]|nr:3-phosphoshikimate 1-carboxyvinyltransferase [Bacteroidales bacterium]